MALKIYDTLAPQGDYPAALSGDIGHGNGRLSDYMPVGVTQAQRDALEAAGVTIPTQLYVIVDAPDYMPEGLNQAQLDALAAAGLLPGGGDG